MGEGQNVKRPQLRHAMPAECQVKQDSKPKFGVEKVTFPLQFCMFVAFIGVFLTSCGFFFFFTFVVFGHQTKRHFWALGPLQWHKAFLKPKFPSKRWLTLQARSTSPPARLFTKTQKQNHSHANTSSACLRRHPLLPFAICCRCKPLLHSSPVPPPVQTTEGLRIAWPQRFLHESQQP